jgi:predicted nucleotidyltransferase
MKVDRREPICGIRPVILKSLLRKGYERFDTPTAMEHLELDEPTITTTLAALQQGGWIEFLGRREGVDGWRPGSKGQRLLATALLKRITRAQAKEILTQLIEEARAINADAAISSRIKQIVLFGSLLTGVPEDTVGDIDVVVTIQRRMLPAGELLALENKEQADAPDSVRYRESALLWWPQTRLRRRLARISSYLSFHPDGDLLGSVHQEVYAYDLEHEREVPPNGDLRTRTSPPVSDLESIANTPYSRTPRDWPSAPKRAMVSEFDGDKARLAQHLWMNGVGIKAIAARVHSRPGSVQAYLASRAGLPNERRLGPIRASLKDTVLEALPGENYFTDCIVSISRAVSRRLALICSDRALRSICAHSIR